MYIDYMCEEDKKIILIQKELIRQLNQNLQELKGSKKWFKYLRIKLWRISKRR